MMLTVQSLTQCEKQPSRLKEESLPVLTLNLSVTCVPRGMINDITKVNCGPLYTLHKCNRETPIL